MQFEVPQFIEIEDKIIGPLTWRQFVYLAGGVGLSIILFFAFPFILFILFGLPIGALSVALAFHRVNNRPFSIFLESAVRYFSGIKLYLWHRETQQSITAELRPESEHYSSELPLEKHIGDISKKLNLQHPQ